MSTSLAWAAGLVDGEGVIDAWQKGAIRLRVEMTHQPTLERLQALLGGRIWDRAPRPNRRRALSLEVCSQREVLSALTRLKPYSVTKLREIEAALAYLRTRRVRRGVALSPEEEEAASRIYWELRRLKSMPAKSKAQLRKAYAACNRGESWGCEMAEKTHSTKGLPERKSASKRSKVRAARSK